MYQCKQSEDLTPLEAVGGSHRGVQMEAIRQSDLCNRFRAPEPRSVVAEGIDMEQHVSGIARLVCYNRASVTSESALNEVLT